MNEEEWLTCTDPEPMVEFLRGNASGRRLALFAVAACRQARWLMEDIKSRHAVEWAEKVIEGQVNWDGDEGPYDGDSYLMAGAAFRCLCAAGCVAEGSIEDVIGNVLLVVLLLEEKEELDGLAVPLRDIFGNPFHPADVDPAWLTSDVVALARGIYDERAFDRMPILADALQDAGCDNDDILNHCRDTSLTHVRGCWVVDLVLGKV